MPPEKKMEDYFYNDLDGSRRWPIGWPARLVYLPPVGECPTLRDHVQTLHGIIAFGGYVKRFLKGPFRLEPEMRERLNRDFGGVRCPYVKATVLRNSMKYNDCYDRPTSHPSDL